MDPNLPRWMEASCRAWFDALRQGIPLYFEHTGLRPVQDDKSYAEFRFDGPYSVSPSKGTTHHYAEINILCTTYVDRADADTISRLTGVFHSAFRNCIPVYRYGDGPYDDQTYVGAMMISDERGEKVRTSYFGQVNPDTNVIQATVEGHYKMTLDE